MFKKSLILSLLLAVSVFAHTVSAAYTAKPGDLLRTAQDATVVLVMDDGTRVPVSADAFALRYNNNFKLVQTVTLAERGEFNSNLVMNGLTSMATGSVFMYDLNQPGIFVIDNGFKRLFMTWSGFEATGNNLNAVQWVGQYSLYPTGPPVQ